MAPQNGRVMRPGRGGGRSAVRGSRRTRNTIKIQAAQSLPVRTMSRTSATGSRPNGGTCHNPAVSETVFRYTRAQRRGVLGSALVLGAWTLAITLYCGVLVVDRRIAEAAGMWATLGFAPLMLSALGAGLARGSTHVDDHGIHASSVWRHWRCSWAEVQSVDEVTELGRGNTITRIRVTRSNGRPFKLPAPYDSRSIGRDPDFDFKLAQIRQKWSAGRKAGSRSA